jgi:hypothetical protein
MKLILQYRNQKPNEKECLNKNLQKYYNSKKFNFTKNRNCFHCENMNISQRIIEFHKKITENKYN